MAFCIVGSVKVVGGGGGGGLKNVHTGVLCCLFGVLLVTFLRYIAVSARFFNNTSSVGS
jgi:hypothetical protein